MWRLGGLPGGGGQCGRAVKNTVVRWLRFLCVFPAMQAWAGAFISPSPRVVTCRIQSPVGPPTSEGVGMVGTGTSVKTLGLGLGPEYVLGQWELGLVCG